jgi:translation initiation factor eIF-2B subunit delta
MSVQLTERLRELRADRRHGASFLARRAAEAIVEVAEAPARTSEELLERLTNAGRQLAEARPGIAAVAGAVGRVLAAADGARHLPPAQLRRLIEGESQALVESRRRAVASIAIQLRGRLAGSVVVTHSASATVREAVLHAAPKRLLCTVSYPVEEGRAFADELRAGGLDVELVEDEDAPARLAGASLLLVGADTVFRDGTLCNKIGTRRLAEAAAEHGVPTVVACEIIKLAPIESTEASDLPSEVRELFDVTPPELVECVVTEEGTFASDELRALIDRTPFLRDGYALLAPR